MKDNYTHLTLVIDRSGSMSSIRDDAEGGINTYITDQKNGEGEATLLLVDFDAPPYNSSAVVAHPLFKDPWYDEKFLGKVQDAPVYHLNPRGNTALFDAVHLAIVKTGEYLAAMAEDDRPSKVMFTIMTDGQENSSHEISLDALNAEITGHTEKFSWEFVFLGAGLDVARQAQAMGVSVRNTTNFAATGQGVQAAFAAHSHSTDSYRSKGFAAYAGMTTDDGDVIMDEDRTEVTK